MKGDILYSIKKYWRHRLAAPYMVVTCLLILSSVCPSYSFADSGPEYAELSVSLSVQDVGSEELPAVIRGRTLYLSVADLFDFLKIKNDYLPGSDSISGFFINEQATFLIDNFKHRISYQDKIVDLQWSDLILTAGNLYLKSELFGEVFGLECTFNFRSLSVTMKSKLELPIVREKRLQDMRLNLDRLKGEVKADTTIIRSNSFFRLGMADWSVNTTEYINGRNSETQLQDWRDLRINLALGAMIAGGEANAVLNYDNNIPLTFRNQYFLWRYVNNDNHVLRQTMVGTINPQATSSIFSPVVGIQLTNSSTLNKQSFGSYRISDFTEPNWMVELYINNILIDYATADSRGFFSFDVPLLYGNSSVTLHYYGPFGEERTSVKNINIPFTLLSPQKLEYTLTGGVVEDNGALFLRGSLNYGLSKHITVGSGVEYLSSVSSTKPMPYVNTTVRIGSRLLFSGEYIYDVRSRGLLIYSGPSNLRLQLSYTRYTEGQEAVYFSYLEERKIDASIPFHLGNVRMYSQLTVNQIVYSNTQYTGAKFLLSGAFSGVGISLTNYALFIPDAEPYLYGDLSLSFKLPLRFLFTPQVQYNYGLGKLIFVKGGLEKPIGHLCYVNLSYEQNLLSHSSIVQVAMRFNFSFTQIGISARRRNSDMVLSQSARGSLMYDRNSKSMDANTRTNVGKGGITIVPFLDMNNNGIHDAGEPKILGLKPRMKGGMFEYNAKDSSFHASNLTPYVNYLVELGQNDFEDLSWQVRNKLIKVVVDPNNFKLVEIPVSVKGEVSGMISTTASNGNKGIGRIKVDFYLNDSTLVFSTITEDDGYFSFLGFAPGSYTARVDPAQLDKLQMTASPSTVSFDILSLRNGDVADGLEFVLGQK